MKRNNSSTETESELHKLRVKVIQIEGKLADIEARDKAARNQEAVAILAVSNGDNFSTRMKSRKVDVSSTKLFTQTSIHGLPDLIQAKSPLAKLAWFALMCGTISFMCFEIVKVSTEFLTNPVYTKYNYVQTLASETPSAVLCPRTWINGTAVKHFGIRNETLYFLLRLTDGGMRLPGPLQVLLDEEMDRNASGILDDIEQISLEQNIKPPKMLNLLKLLALKPGEIIHGFPTTDMLTTYGTSIKSMYPVVLSALGLCYNVEFNPVKSRTLATELIFPVKINQSADLLDILSPPDVGIGFDFGSSCLVNSVFRRISFGAHHQVLLKRTDFNRVSTRVHPCSPRISIHAQKQCYLRCYQRKVKALYNCTTVLALDCLGLVEGAPECPFPHQPPNIPDEGFMENCTRNCADPCVRTVWDFEINTGKQYKHMANNSMFLIFTMPTPFHYLESREFESYTLETFVSNIGGQLGFWLGASLVSVMQLMKIGLAIVVNWCKKKRLQYNLA